MLLARAGAGVRARRQVPVAPGRATPRGAGPPGRRGACRGTVIRGSDDGPDLRADAQHLLQDPRQGLVVPVTGESLGVTLPDEAQGEDTVA